MKIFTTILAINTALTAVTLALIASQIERPEKITDSEPARPAPEDRANDSFTRDDWEPRSY